MQIQRTERAAAHAGTCLEAEPPIQEPDPDRLPDETPLPNPDETQEPPCIWAIDNAQIGKKGDATMLSSFFDHHTHSERREMKTGAGHPAKSGMGKLIAAATAILLAGAIGVLVTDQDKGNIPQPSPHAIQQ